MAKKVTQRDIEAMNEAYLTIGTYAGVAKALGWSASTVKRYINPNYTHVSIVKKEITLPPVAELYVPRNLNDWLLLSPQEIEEIKEFKSREVAV